MVGVNYLLDTDILIDWLQGRSWAKEMISSGGARLYCSAVTRKELLSKPGISSTERDRILRLLRVVRVITVDPVIAAGASELLLKYPNDPLRVNDALIAATAWVKKLPLVTRNRKHYEFIAEITLVDFSPTSP
jgi:predicted nucleic acid-binding protein